MEDKKRNLPVSGAEPVSMEILLAEVSGLRKQISDMRSTIDQIRSLVGPFGVPLPDGTMLVQTIYSIKYCIDPLDEIIAPNLIIYRQWESSLSQLFISAAHKDMKFVDVGANFGYFTCLMGSKIGRAGQGKVYAVEPNPKMCSLLRRNCSINWSMSPIEIVDAALSYESGKAQFSIPKHRASNASLSVSPNAASAPDTDTVEVAIKTLDEIIPAGTSIDLMKIDVEGHEWGVLQGARRVIGDSPDLRIVMEWSQAQMKSAGYSPQAMFNSFRELNLAAHLVPKSLNFADLSGEGLSLADLQSIPYENLVLVRSKT